MPDAPDVIVVGAGAAGIFAAWRAASMGARTLLLEKNDRIGIKILISGGGKCNVTHDCSVQELLHAFRPNEARFLKAACYKFQSTEVVQMLESCGLELYTRSDGRIFPVEGTAKDVVRIFGDYLLGVDVETRLNCPVLEISASDGKIVGVVTAEGLIPCPKVILSVGGMSYPKTGTTGDGYPWARALGHTVTKIRPALAPIYLEMESDWTDERAGVALRDCLLKARQGKEIARWRGDLLFTHRGVSGPTVLGVSRVVAERLVEGPVTLEADLTPDQPHEALSAAILELAKAGPRRALPSLIPEWAPQSLAASILADAEIEGATPLGQLTTKARNRLVETIKSWPLGQVKLVPIDKGEVVAGGVSLDEVDPSTMQSRKCDGLYLCGEILDIAGPVGGYNLQAAFSTGYVAGQSAASASGHAG